MEFKSGDFLFPKLNHNTCKVGCSDNSLNTQNANGLIAGTSSTITTVIIPAYVKDETTKKLYKVIETNTYCFKLCSKIVSLSLPDTLECIGYDSFAQTSITELIIPSSVNYISKAGLSQMHSLKSVIFLPGSKIELLNWAFLAYSQVKTIIIPPLVKEISQAFYLASQLKSIYYCGSYDLSNFDAAWGSSGFTVYVTSQYHGSKFAGQNYQIDKSNTCLPYEHYIDQICFNTIKYHQAHFLVSLFFIIIIN